MPKRCIGVCVRNCSRRADGIFLLASVLMTPGAMQFAVMPRRPYSAAMAFVKAATPPLVPAYAVIPASPVVPVMDVMLIMRPYSFFSMCGRACLHRLYGTIKFACIMFCKKFGSERRNRRPSTRLALFTTMSRRPNCFMVSWINDFVASAAVRSSGMHNGVGALLSLLINFSRNAVNFSWLRPVMTTCAPRL